MEDGVRIFWSNGEMTSSHSGSCSPEDAKAVLKAVVDRPVVVSFRGNGDGIGDQEVQSLLEELVERDYDLDSFDLRISKSTDPNKRYGTPRARSGQIKLQWGRSADFGEDIFLCWGSDGGHRADAAMMISHFTQEFVVGRRLGGREYRSRRQDLENLGFDIRSLRVSVERTRDHTREETIPIAPFMR